MVPIQTTKPARVLLFKVLKELSSEEKRIFRIDIARRFDEIICGEEKREYKILPSDIVSILQEGNYKVSKKHKVHV